MWVENREKLKIISPEHTSDKYLKESQYPLVKMCGREYFYILLVDVSVDTSFPWVNLTPSNKALNFCIFIHKSKISFRKLFSNMRKTSLKF